MDARNLNLGPHASKANNLCSEEFPSLLFCFHQWFNANNKCPFTWLPGWKELRHLECLEEHWAWWAEARGPFLLRLSLVLLLDSFLTPLSPLPSSPLPHLYPSSSAPSSYYYFYFKLLGGVYNQLSHRFVEKQDVFIVLNLKYALRASKIKLGNRLYQRA